MNTVADKEILIAASVSCMDMMHMQKSMEESEEAGIDFYHYDIVDGHFNHCFILGQTLLEKMRALTKLPIEVHLAVEHPERYIKQYIDCGADYIGVHYESTGEILDMFGSIIGAGAMPTLQLKAETDYNERMLPLLKKASWVNKLTVHPGYSGQKMQGCALEHIRGIRDAIHAAGLATKIQADGNIQENTIWRVVEAGATILTGGSSGLFVQGSSVKENIGKMRRVAQDAFHRS